MNFTVISRFLISSGEIRCDCTYFCKNALKVKVGVGKVVLFLWTYINLHVYPKSICNVESEERLDKVCTTFDVTCNVFAILMLLGAHLL